MRLETPLDDVFRARSHVRILRSLDELPEGFPASAREIGRRAGLSHPTASNVLSFLVTQGLVLVRRAPRAYAFELNREHVLFQGITELFEHERRLTDELVSFLRREIGQRATLVSEAFLFGSVARKATTPTSDIDVALICPADDADRVTNAMEAVADAVRRRFGNSLNVILATGSVDEQQGPGRRGRRLWKRIAEEGIRILPWTEELAPGA